VPSGVSIGPRLVPDADHSLIAVSALSALKSSRPSMSGNAAKKPCQYSTTAARPVNVLVGSSRLPSSA
jgi:hypothetical protein